MLKPPNNPMDLIEIPHSLTLNENIRKEDVAPSVAKVIALDTIHEHYPPNNWLHIYTDGSLQNTEVGAGAGVTCDLFSFYKGLGKYTTNFDGEVEAIKLATQQLLYRTHCFNQAVILSDSKAAIQAIVNTNENTSDKIREIRAILKQLRQLKKIIAIQWVPAHCGLEGNEKADVLAKKGTKILATPQTNISFDSAKRLIKLNANNKHNKWLSEKATRQKWEALVKTPDIYIYVAVN
ncbi:hypothetical protein WDU94_012235 [Cyamophila willieti]